MIKRHIIGLFLTITCILSGFSQADSIAVITGWRLVDNQSKIEAVDIDTGLVDFQRFYPHYQNSISNTYLGNLGLPTMPNVLSQRVFDEDLFFLNQYLPYFQTAENTKYFNTRKPFSRLTYYYAYPKTSKEEAFEAFHTQNINPKLNFGLRYFIIKSKGQYSLAEVRRQNSFRLNTSYTGQRYTAHAVFNVNNSLHDENGGVIDSIFELDTIESTLDIPTRFSGTGSVQKLKSNVSNHVRYYDIFLAQRFKLFTIASKVDSAQLDKGRNVAEPVISYVFNARRASKTYMDSDPLDHEFYQNIYFNNQETLDSVADFHVANALRLEFKTTFRRKIQVGVYGTLGNEFDKYSMYSKWDTLYNPNDTIVTGADTLLNPYVFADGRLLRGIDTTHNWSSTYFSTGFYANLMNRMKMYFDAKIYFIGDKSGQTDLRGAVNTNIDLLNKPFQFDIIANFKNKVPGYLLQNYYSNHYIWNTEERTLKSEKLTGLSGKISAPSNKFELSGNYYLFSDKIYFNQESKPENYGNSLSVLSVELSKTFTIWKLSSENTIVYQASENQSVLPIPNFMFFNSTYINHTFHFKSTGGEIQTIIGWDLYYLTDYYGYSYSPALAQFHVQDSKYIGNYPLIDTYLNVKLKRVRFFAKLQHLNSLLLKPNYYSAISYPHRKWSFNVGLSWVFYD